MRSAAVLDKTRTTVEAECPRTLAGASRVPRGRVFPSPQRWKDQVLYQLLPDRFSDGKENERPLYDRNRPNEHKAHDKRRWMTAGNQFVGGNIKGISSKLDYLQGLGVTGLWLNPPWKQRRDLETYHGYGIQNYLDIDPRFGTRQDLRDLVDAAHDRGMYVIVDVIFNHSGNNFFYADGTGTPRDTMPYRYSPPHEVQGWRDAHGRCVETPLSTEDGVWPEEFQNPNFYTRAGEIGHWAQSGWEDPMSPYVEFRRGDFYDLKDMNLENPEAMNALIKVYQYWIALTDCDGFRMDALKHVSKASSRQFCSGIWQFAQSIGKDNFLLTGEITDNRMILDYMEVYGTLIDTSLPVALDIVASPNQMTALAKGHQDPSEFFSRFSPEHRIGRYLQLGAFHVSVVDDHDMSSRGYKQRFGAFPAPNVAHLQSANVVAIQLTTPGIPCIYYGTEQGFDGNEGYHDYTVEPRRFAEDRYIREAMFGGEFGAFGTEHCHFFNPDHPTYKLISAITRLRQKDDIVGRLLRGGKVFLRETSYCNQPFNLPPRGELTAWSRTLSDNEILIALNTNANEDRGAEVTVDAGLHPDGSSMTFLFRNDWNDEQLADPPKQSANVRHLDDGRAVVRLDLPPAGMAILF